MDKIKVLISAVVIVSLLGSCQKEPVFDGSIANGVISPRVSTTAVKTKVNECSNAGKCIASYTMEGLSDKPLYVTVFEYDNEDLPFGMSEPETKGTVTTTTSINAVGQQFLMDAWLESVNRYDGSQDGDGQIHITQDMTDWHFIKNATVERGSSEWNFAGGAEYPWRNQVKTNFWSVYPTSAAGRTITYPSNTAADEDQLVLSMLYSLPTPCSASPYIDAQNQKDLCFAFNTKTWQTGSDNTVDIKFYHALAAVYFNIDSVQDATVEQIGFNNICSSAACDITGGSDNTATFAWKNQSGLKNIRQDFVTADFDAISKEQSLTGSDKIFMLIPQTLGSNTEMAVTFKKSNGSMETKTANISKLPNGAVVEWKPGKKYLYTISHETHTFTYEFELTNESDLTQSFTNITVDSPAQSVAITSNKVRDDLEKTSMGWAIKSYKIGTSDPVTVGGTSFTAGGITAEATADGNLKLTAHERINPNVGGHEYWTGDNGNWSPEDWTSTTASSPIDLSKFNFKNESINNPMTTANCYIIRHAGTYKIPLVYGNGVVDGNENTQSYFPDETGGTNRLEIFLNHKGDGIQSAFIENNTGCKADDCCIVWQDEAFVIKNLEIVGSEAGTYTKDNVRYLQFTVDPSTICQNNAIIAVKDGSGNIMWSWLIWTTNDPTLLGAPYEVSNTYGDFSFFPMNSIGWMDATEYPERDDVIITIEQSETGNTIDITVKQPEVTEQAHGNYYQFGRKDPMCRKDSPVTEGFIMGGTGKVDLKTAIMNPGTFYSDGSVSGDWCSSTYDNLWTGKLSTRYEDIQSNGSILAELPAPTKTIYDPSPAGYQMPMYHALVADATVFPAKGLRHRRNGTKQYETTVYYWSAFPNNDNAGRYGYATNTDITQRAHAMSVRPVLEPK